jgi:hypothetical protein
VDDFINILGLLGVLWEHKDEKQTLTAKRSFLTAASCT